MNRKLLVMGLLIEDCKKLLLESLGIVISELTEYFINFINNDPENKLAILGKFETANYELIDQYDREVEARHKRKVEEVYSYDFEIYRNCMEEDKW